MLLTYKIILLTSLYYLTLYADTNSPESSYIDDTHNLLSDTVYSWSDSIDTTLSGSFSDSNLTKIEKTREKSNAIDSFFQTRKFIDETDQTFVRLNFNSFFQSKSNDNFKYKIRAHIPLSRTKKSYNLFIEDITQDNIKNTLSNENLNEGATPDIGINFFVPKTYGVNSKYSIGTSGVNPFIRARFNLNFKTDSWIIEPVQQFKYSSNHKFEEETNIYFDKLLSSSELLRFTIYRATQEEENGMDYAFIAQYYTTLKQHAAISISQSFSGNTQYQDITYNSDMSESTSTYKGINTYFTSLNWRQNVWKKWFYYEVTPGVSFSKQYDYEANYSVRFSIDMYFGKLYKK